MGRKLALLLTAVYVVKLVPTIYLSGNEWKKISSYKVGVFDCGLNKEECEDLAAALNQAHERRIKESIAHEDGTLVPCVDSKDFSCEKDLRPIPAEIIDCTTSDSAACKK